MSRDMIIEDIKLNHNEHPMYIKATQCSHAWEPHLWDDGRAYCPKCGSFAKWANDPRPEARKP